MADVITLITKENEKIKVSVGLSKMSKLLQGIVEDSGCNDEIPIELISKTTLDLIIKYAEHHNYRNPAFLPMPLPVCDFSSLIDPWHRSFLSDLSEELFNDLLSASNYLEMKALLNLLLGFLASKFQGKDISTLSALYNISEPLTADLEDELIKEHSWIFEAQVSKLGNSH